MKTRKPAWWQLYLLVPIMLGLVALEALRPLPGVSDQIVDAAIVLLFFGSMLFWVHANGGLLERYYMEHDEPYDFKVTLYAPPPGESPYSVQVWNYDRLPHKGQNIALREQEKWSRN